ncbi:formate transporter FocA [Vibrio sp. HA2012]|uniref:formate transporter FocA n=1 Tax=Vibrio sp. HA2012 TaxID=1971595 RepID=UPI000C2BBBBD|nr:formate transporter FocA [Vibrio sp. HA2012]PJC87449.1 formate transporter FocA [Vibrio sp. HA2012]
MSASNPIEARQFFSPNEMMLEAEKYAVYKAKKSTSMTIGLAIMAGIFIGIAFLFYITVTTGNGAESWGLSHFAGGIAFSLGLILVVLCGGELFTSSVLTSIACANREISVKKMLSIWGKVYIGNFIGALFLLFIVSVAALYQSGHGEWGLNALNIAQHKLHHTTAQAFALGVLCNLLVCLAIWLTFSTGNALAKAFMVILPVAMFVSSGFEHCVANMFMVPLGIVIQSTAPESFWQAVGATPAQYADLNLPHFITANLIPVTLGNIVGGAVLVGLANWTIFSRPQLKASSVTPITQPITTSSDKETTMNTNILVKDMMIQPAFSLRVDMPTELALDALIDRNLQGAPVTDVQGRLVGFFSMHDVMVELWCQDYIPAEGQKVVDLMNRDVIAIDANDSLVNVAEYLCIDKEQLYPVSSAGIAIRLNSLSVEERAKSMNISKPHTMPVLDNGELVGVISRFQVAKALRSVYGERLDIVEDEATKETA